MMGRAPGAIGMFAVLADETDTADVAAKIYIGFGTIKRAVIDFRNNADNKVLNNVACAGALVAFTGRNDLFDVFINVELAQPVQFDIALFRRNQAFDLMVNGVVLVFGEQRKVGRQFLGDLKKRVRMNFWFFLCHALFSICTGRMSDLCTV